MADQNKFKWGMVIDVDRCTGCEACVVACQAENNIPLNEEDRFHQGRAIEWIRIERYWEGEYPNVKAKFLPVLCQHCDNALRARLPRLCHLPQRPGHECPGLQQVCRHPILCKQRSLPGAILQLLGARVARVAGKSAKPDVTVRTRGLMEKCSFCVQRIRRTERDLKNDGRDLRDGELQPACAQTCPTDALVFGNMKDPKVVSLSSQRATDTTSCSKTWARSPT